MRKWRKYLPSGRRVTKKYKNRKPPYIIVNASFEKVNMIQISENGTLISTSRSPTNSEQTEFGECLLRLTSEPYFLRLLPKHAKV